MPLSFFTENIKQHAAGGYCCTAYVSPGAHLMNEVQVPSLLPPRHLPKTPAAAAACCVTRLRRRPPPGARRSGRRWSATGRRRASASPRGRPTTGPRQNLVNPPPAAAASQQTKAGIMQKTPRLNSLHHASRSGWSFVSVLLFTTHLQQDMPAHLRTSACWCCLGGCRRSHV